MIEGQAGLTWARWKAIVARVERWGFAGLYRSDHFTMATPPVVNSLEMIVSLTYLADHTSRLHFGPLVAPLSFRDPVMLARQAAALDDLSGGRMILGVGAGWQEREHNMFGYPLGDKRLRLERLTEGLTVVSRLLHDDKPVSFEGKYYHLRDAEIPPRPGHTRILVGGNGRTRTLPLAARFADIWNGVQLGPDQFRELSAVLDAELRAEGRDPRSLKRTAATFFFFGKNQAALTERINNLRMWGRPALDTPFDQAVRWIRQDWHAVVGLADEIIPQIHAYAGAGVEELMLQTLDSDDLDGIEAFAEQVLPHVG